MAQQDQQRPCELGHVQRPLGDAENHRGQERTGSTPEAQVAYFHDGRNAVVMASNYGGFADYRETAARTGREVPVFRLSPR
ncbi:MAG: hypothetical protein WAL26_25660 [Mycobacterium sp.]